MDERRRGGGEEGREGGRKEGKYSIALGLCSVIRYYKCSPLQGPQIYTMQ